MVLPVLSPIRRFREDYIHGFRHRSSAVPNRPRPSRSASGRRLSSKFCIISSFREGDSGSRTSSGGFARSTSPIDGRPFGTSIG